MPFIKWRELSLSYRFPSKLMENIGFDQLSIGVTVRNLAILYKNVPHIDPESAFSSGTGSQGIEYAQIPPTRSIGFNLNLKFKKKRHEKNQISHNSFNCEPINDIYKLRHRL